jgi:hypothetical protein
MPDFHGNICAHSGRWTLKGVLVHHDNTRRHISKRPNEYLTELRDERVPHPADSPDSIPNHLFLFGIVKTELQHYEIHNRQDLILAIRTIFEQISKNIPDHVYVS